MADPTQPTYQEYVDYKKRHIDDALVKLPKLQTASKGVTVKQRNAARTAATTAATADADLYINDQIAAYPGKQRTALELATGIDLAEHVLSGQTVAKAATDALTTAATTANAERTALEIATGIELTDHALIGIEKQKVIDAATTAAAIANATKSFSDRLFKREHITEFEIIYIFIAIIISIILFAVFGSMIARKTEPQTSINGIVLISILSASIFLYLVYLAFTNTILVNGVTDLYPTTSNGIIICIFIFICLAAFLPLAANKDYWSESYSICGVIMFNILLIGFILAYINDFLNLKSLPIYIVSFIIIILFICISLILGYMFSGWAILVNLFALFLFTLLYYGSTGLYQMFDNWYTPDVKDDKIDPITYYSGIAIIIFTCIAILLGIFTIVFPPADYHPGNPDKAYSNIKNIIYVLVALIGLIIIGLIGKNWKIFPGILSSGVSYIS